MNNSDRNRIIVGAATTADATNDSQEMPPPYLKLIADCWEHIFDNLSFKDILVMGQTCKRMNRMAGYYIREYYPQLKFQLIGREIVYRSIHSQSDFYPFIGRLIIYGNEGLTLLSNFNTFDALKTITFIKCTLTETQIDSIQSVLKNVDLIRLDQCDFAGNEKIANYCPKLKQMNVSNCDAIAELYSQHFTKLERLCYWPSDFTRIDELKMFLEKHTKLKQFETDCRFLWANRDVLIQTNIKLDLLKLHFDGLDLTDDLPFDQFIEFLKTLHERGFYKTLSFSKSLESDGNERIVDAISTLSQLEKLSIDSLTDSTRLINLNELNIECLDYVINIETLAKNLPKLEQLTLETADINHFLPFLRHSKRLKTIKINWLENGGLDLFALNQERVKLENACKVSIYVDDHEYLNTKWKSHNLNVELDLVKIMRFDNFIIFYGNY